MLGVEVMTLHGEDVAETLVNFAQTHKVRHAIFGKTERSPIKERIFGSVVQNFINDSVGIDVHIVAATPIGRTRNDNASAFTKKDPARLPGYSCHVRRHGYFFDPGRCFYNGRFYA